LLIEMRCFDQLRPGRKAWFNARFMWGFKHLLGRNWNSFDSKLILVGNHIFMFGNHMLAITIFGGHDLNKQIIVQINRCNGSINTYILRLNTEMQFE
jgi:hypothetical protein